MCEESNIYESRTSAILHAMRFQDACGGTLRLNMRKEVCGEGEAKHTTYGMAVVCFGEINENNLTGENWVEFLYPLNADTLAEEKKSREDNPEASSGRKEEEESPDFLEKINLNNAILVLRAIGSAAARDIQKVPKDKRLIVLTLLSFTMELTGNMIDALMNELKASGEADAITKEQLDWLKSSLESILESKPQN